MLIFRMHSPGRDVFDSTGSTIRNGRWHMLGDRVIYASENISLAALETLIYSGGKRIPDRVVTSIEVPDSLLIETVSWQEKPASQEFGERWLREGRSVLLKVPSVAADKMESNFVVNPAHSDFKWLRALESRPFSFDSRFIHLQTR